MTIFGTLTGEMVYSSNRTTPFGAPALVSPRITGRDTPSVEVHGKSTSVGLQFFGPEVWGFRSGGLIYTYLWGDEVLSNQYGLFFQEAFGELWNDDWRFAAGLQQDLIAPLNPTTLNWSRGYLSGNAGFIRGSFASSGS